ncbi:MAG: alkaline phosphatase family protein [Rhodomicrobium sp.]|nr:alkaline phosphatase family protein [Rhodomicrobium sp.]
MINDSSLSRFEPLGSGLLKPIYADYSFGNLASTIYYLLTGERMGALLPEDCFGGSYPRPDKVVLFFIDAFGWRSWQEHAGRSETMHKVKEYGVLTPISAIFPSTTSASVTTLNLGALPAEHGLYEWNVYVPAYGEVIQTLPFSPIGSHARELCLRKGYDPAALLAMGETLHEKLARHGVKSFQFAHRNHSDSSYNRMICRGAEVFAHNTLAEAMVQLKDAVERIKGKSWFNFYWASIDSIAHQYGPGSRYQDAEIAAFWSAFDTLLGGLKSENTLFLFTADHDQVFAKGENNIFLNERIPALADVLPLSPSGNPIYPNGSPRDLFLHVKRERREEALALLKAEFEGIAEILPMDEALSLGLFGPSQVSAELRRRLGDILILPHDGYFISWREPGLIENRFLGHHGGLAAAELISVLGVLDHI